MCIYYVLAIVYLSLHISMLSVYMITCQTFVYSYMHESYYKYFTILQVLMVCQELTDSQKTYLITKLLAQRVRCKIVPKT